MNKQMQGYLTKTREQLTIMETQVTALDALVIELVGHNLQSRTPAPNYDLLIRMSSHTIALCEAKWRAEFFVGMLKGLFEEDSNAEVLAELLRAGRLGL